MSADHKGDIGFEGKLEARVIKHGPIKRQFNKLRKQRVLKESTEVDVLKVMRG